MGGGTAADSRPRINLSIEVVASAPVRSGTLPCHGTARWYGREGDGIGGKPKESDDRKHAGGVVQLVRTPVTQEAAGSSPVAPAK